MDLLVQRFHVAKEIQMEGKGKIVVNGGLGTRSSGEGKHLGLNVGNGKVGPSNTKYFLFHEVSAKDS